MISKPIWYEALPSGILFVTQKRDSEYTIQFVRIAVIALPEIHKYRHLDELPKVLAGQLKSLQSKLERSGGQYDYISHREKYLYYKNNEVDYKSVRFETFRGILSKLIYSDVELSFSRPSKDPHKFLIIGRELVLSKDITYSRDETEVQKTKALDEQLDRIQYSIQSDLIASKLDEYENLEALASIFWFDTDGTILFHNVSKQHPQLIELHSQIVTELVESLQSVYDIPPALDLDSGKLIAIDPIHQREWIMFKSAAKEYRLMPSRYLVAGSENRVNDWINGVMSYEGNTVPRVTNRILIVGSKRPLGFKQIKLDDFRFDLLFMLKSYPKEFYLPALQIIEKSYGLKSFGDNILEVWYNMDPEIRNNLDWETFYYKMTANNSYDLLPGHGDQLLFNISAGFNQFTKSHIFSETKTNTLPQYGFIDTTNENIKELMIQLYCLQLRGVVDSDVYDMIVINDQTLTIEMTARVYEDILEKVYRSATLLFRTTRYITKKEASFDLILLENNDSLIEDLRAETKFTDYANMIRSGNPLLLSEGNNPIFLDLIPRRQMSDEILIGIEQEEFAVKDAENPSVELSEVETPIDQLDEPKDSEVDGSDTEVVDQVRYKRSILVKVKGFFSRLKLRRSKHEVKAPTTQAKPDADTQQAEEEEWVSPTMEATRAGRTTMFTPISTLREEANADGKPASHDKEMPDVDQETITTDLSPDAPSEEVEFHVEFDRIYAQYSDVVQIEEYVAHWKTHKLRLDHHKKIVELQDQHDTAVVAAILHQLGKEITFKQIMKAVKPYLDLSSPDLENILHVLEKEKQHISRLRTKNFENDIITITWTGKKYKHMLDRRMRQTQHLLDPIKDDDVLLIHLSAINEKLRSRSMYHQMIALIRWIQVLNYMHFKRQKLLDPRLASLEASLDIEKPVDNVEDFLKELQVKYIPIVHQISTQIMATPQQLPITRTMTSKEMHRMPTLGSQSPAQVKSEQIGLDPVIVPKLDNIKGSNVKPKSKSRTKKPIKEETSPQVGVQEEFEVSTVKTGKLQKPIKFKKNKPITSKEKVDADGLRHHEQLVEYTKDDVDKATKFWTTQKRVKSSKKFFVIQPGVGVNPDTPDISTPIYHVIADFPISSLAVDRRFRKILKRAKLQTLGEVANTTVDFTSVKGVGKKTTSAIIHLQAILQRAEVPKDILHILTDEGIVELSTQLKHEVKLTDTDMSRSTLFPLETEEVDQFKALIDAGKTPLEVGDKVIAYLFELLHVEGEAISFDAKCNLLNQYQSKNHPLLLKQEYPNDTILVNPDFSRFDLMWLLSKDQQYRDGDLESLHEVKQLIMDDIRKLRFNKNNTFVAKKIEDAPADNLERTKTEAKQAKQLI